MSVSDVELAVRRAIGGLGTRRPIGLFGLLDRALAASGPGGGCGGSRAAEGAAGDPPRTPPQRPAGSRPPRASQIVAISLPAGRHRRTLQWFRTSSSGAIGSAIPRETVCVCSGPPVRDPTGMLPCSCILL